MTAETKQLVLGALRDLRSDDFERAQRSFAGFTDAQMDQIYGSSGNTCREILDIYAKKAERIKRAIEEVKAIPVTPV